MATNLGTQPDIRKIGYLKKLKTNRKKLFLLREQSAAGPARLEYYNDRKLRAGAVPRRTIILSSCFSITKKSDSRHKWAIALFTKDDCFSLVCDCEEEQKDWLNALLDMQRVYCDEADSARPKFEHIWQVTVQRKGLGNAKNLTPGPYRLCLTNKKLSFVLKNQEISDIEFQLAEIRRCGHTQCYFFMEVGRGAATGEGMLWMKVEDTVIAQNMHEVILSSMMSSTSEQTNFRPRSRSSASDRSGSKAGFSRGISPSYDSGSATLPKRSKTITGYDHPASPPASRLRPSSSRSGSSRSSVTSLGRGHSPITSSPLSHALAESHRTRTDSMESRGTASSLSADELDLSPLEHFGTSPACSANPDGLDTVEEIMGIESLVVSPSSELITNCDMYMEMGYQEEDEAYMDMSPGTPIGESSYLDMTPASYSSSPAASTSSRDTDDHGYLDMAPVAHSLPTVKEKTTDGGYFDMSSCNITVKRPNPTANPKLRPDKVYSYLSDESSVDEFPLRTYSVGSKPMPKSSPGDGTGYMDMTSKQGGLDKAGPKSNSAPHLDKERSCGSRVSLTEMPTKMGGGTRKEMQPELFMELDFKRDDLGIRPRTASGGRDLRETRLQGLHTEQDYIRVRTSSFGRESSGMLRSVVRAESQRPRTATICQDSFRNRTSSFGASDMRPRSSSYGNARFRRRTSKESSRHSSNESLRRVAHRTSQESLRSNLSTEYLDMMSQKSGHMAVPSRAQDGDQSQSSYMSMEHEGSPGQGRESAKATKLRMSSRSLHLRVPSTDSSSSLSSSPGSTKQGRFAETEPTGKPPVSGSLQKGPQIDDSYAVFTPLSATASGRSMLASAAVKQKKSDVSSSATHDYLNVDLSQAIKAKLGPVPHPTSPHKKSPLASPKLTSSSTSPKTSVAVKPGIPTSPLPSTPSPGKHSSPARKCPSPISRSPVPTPPTPSVVVAPSPADMSDYADMTLGSSLPASTTQGSLTPTHEVHYAALDLGSSTEDLKCGERSPHLHMSARSPTSIPEDSPAMTYAEIDFQKSESLRQIKTPGAKVGLLMKSQAEPPKRSPSPAVKVEEPPKPTPERPAPFDLS